MSKKDGTNKTIKAVDFFCSAGGVTCGFRQAGIDVLGGIDIDKTCKETYEKNNNARFLHADISDLSKKEVGKFFGIRRNQRELIFAGCSPCQYYSNIKTNKSKSQNTRLLLEDFQEFVVYFRPGYVFIENVPGLDKNPKSPLGKFKAFLKKNGYVFSEDVLNAKYFGVPQNRRRYVLLATRLRNNIELPKPDKKNLVTVRKAIGDKGRFPTIEAGHQDNSLFKHSASSLSKKNLQRIINTDSNGGDRRSWPKELQLECYKSHSGHYDVYGRMYWDKPSPTITQDSIAIQMVGMDIQSKIGLSH